MSRRPRTSDDTDQGFLKRWSRRKTGPDDSEPPDREPSDPESAPAQSIDDEAPAAGTAETGERTKTDDDMPELDTIAETTDMSDFFSPGVSEELRTQALRRLFRLPKFNVTDGLDDYNDDFRNFALLGDIVTSDMRHRAELAEQRSREAGEPVADLELEEESPEEQADETAMNEEHGDDEPDKDQDLATSEQSSRGDDETRDDRGSGTRS